MASNSDDKYITFKREDFAELVGLWSTRDLREYPPSSLLSAADVVSLVDAVVIRRQDIFASPALAGYAAGIAIAIRLTDDEARKNQLLAVADYFQRQSELAADEGWKLPDV